jgi:hypothetical protein
MGMAIRNTITPELAEERARLVVELADANARAAARFKGDLAGFAEAEAEVAAIVRRIKEIDGTTGQQWDA